MSTIILKIIPSKPSYVPNSIQMEKAKAFLSQLYKDNQIKFLSFDTVVFVDQGENFESVSCNMCGKEIQMEIWQEEMNKASQKQFTDLSFQTPCNHKTSLNDLIYKSPAGFSKFIISVSDAKEELNTNNMEQLQEILGTQLRIIWAHY